MLRALIVNKCVMLRALIVNKFVMLRALTTPLVSSNLSDKSSVNIDNINQFELIFVLKM
jgi:hypothetical protein